MALGVNVHNVNLLTTYLHPDFEYKFTFKKPVCVLGYGLDGSGFVCRLVQEIFLCKGPDRL
jgi:hypothetical protein